MRLPDASPGGSRTWPHRGNGVEARQLALALRHASSTDVCSFPEEAPETPNRRFRTLKEHNSLERRARSSNAQDRSGGAISSYPSLTLTWAYPKQGAMALGVLAVVPTETSG